MTKGEDSPTGTRLDLPQPTQKVSPSASLVYCFALQHAGSYGDEFEPRPGWLRVFEIRASAKLEKLAMVLTDILGWQHDHL